MSQALTLAKILEADDVAIERVDCPEWGGHVFIRSVTADKLDAFDERFMRDADGKRNLVGFRAAKVAMHLCDEKGKFLNPSEAEITALGKKGTVMDRLLDACEKVSGDGDLEDLKKNSPDPAAGNGSG